MGKITKSLAAVCILIIIIGTGCTFQQQQEESVNGLTLSTHDGLHLMLNENGVIESLKIDDSELIDNPSQAFWIRDFTDFEIENLITNPGFEHDGDKDGTADGWTVFKISGEMDISLDKNSKSGSKSVRMTAQSSEKQNRMAYASSFVPVKGDTEYLLSVYAQNNFGYLEDWWALSVYVYCIFYDGQKDEITQEEMQVHHTLMPWKQFSKIVVSPFDAKEARIGIVFNGPKHMTVPGVQSSTTWIDDVVFGEMPEKTKIKAVSGTLKRKRDTIVYEGTFDGLKFQADYQSKGEYIEINWYIENTTRVERVLDISFLPPVTMQGWTWWDDVRTWREIQDGLYNMTVNVDESGNLPLSVYPLSAMTEDVGLSLAVPLSKPRIFEIFYDESVKKCGVSFKVGLSPETTFQTADFTVYVYRCDPEWGFRDALNRYYTYFPEYFEEKIGLEFSDAEWEFSDFGIRHIQGHFSSKGYVERLQELNQRNVFACEYTLPSAFEPQSLQSITEPCPHHGEFVALIDYYAEHGGPYVAAKARGAQASVIYESNGSIVLGEIDRGPNWAPDKWVGKFPLNCDPDLPGYTIADAMMDVVRAAFETAETYDAVLNGVELDNFMKISRYLDMDQSRFQYTDIPLTYNPNNFKPGIHAMASMVEYLQHLSDWLLKNEPHAVMTGNCIERGVSSFGFPYLAALPFEMSSVSRWNFDDTELNYRRSMAYHRITMAVQCGKMCDENGAVLTEQVHQFINESIFYGIYPVMKDDFFQLCDCEPVREIYKKVIPLLDELYIAGWEPIPFAKTDNLKVNCERFGKSIPVYMTVRNFGDTAADYNLVIQGEKLGIGKNVVITEMLSGKEVFYEYENGNIIIRGYIKVNETKIFKISGTLLQRGEITALYNLLSTTRVLYLWELV